MSPFLKGLLISYAFTAVLNAPLRPEFFEDRTDFLTASVYELLGSYSLSFFLIWILAAGFIFLYSEYSSSHRPNNESALPKKSLTAISVFFGFTSALGRFYQTAGYGHIFFGSLVNIAKIALVSAGFSLVFYTISTVILQIFLRKNCDMHDSPETVQVFYKGKVFFKSFSVMGIFYLPFLILSFPGGLCYDGIGQMEQVLNGAYTKHHPLAHTLIMGGTVKCGDALGSPEAGVFVYVCLQTVLLLSAFALSISVLAKLGVKDLYLKLLTALYCLTPLYTNLTTMAIKDVPYGAFVLIYVILLCLFIRKPERVKNPKAHILFVLIQVLVILMRNNGLPLIFISGLVSFILISVKDKKYRRIIYPAALFAEAVVAGLLVTALLTALTGAKAGSKGEILSLPFQQTAYTHSVNPDAYSDAEKEAIEGVLGDTEVIAADYDPLIADTVKMHYITESGLGDNIAYLGAWFTGGLKHPVLYTKAFAVHTYGWFSPAVSNEIRYEVDYGEIKTGLLFPGADKVMIFLYRFAAAFTPLGVLENCGIYVFVLSLVTLALIKERRLSDISATVPAWTSLLICMASPCFFGHPRYALPIFVSVPFVTLFMFAGKNTSNR